MRGATAPCPERPTVAVETDKGPQGAPTSPARSAPFAGSEVLKPEPEPEPLDLVPGPSSCSGMETSGYRPVEGLVIPLIHQGAEL